MEIGQQVYWKVGNITRYGTFMNNELVDEALVICTKANDTPMALKCKVKKSILNKV